eukprot:TRINITY_DN3044_c0_g1_i1.p1 TRINITY_DN3044_c0_g1~~TRINITY_DN3044_c0_g1_i1.p1  ORF type:complete len:574 (-),score=75.60 TRINITY_DN3044_c0_g1_i1:340-1977(-)
MSVREKVISGSRKYPKPENVDFKYGTAGFRGEASSLPSVLYRCGILAALRSTDCSGSGTGIMVTASHNPEQDNGVKLVEPTGEMLSPKWEVIATELTSFDDHEAFYEKVVEIEKRVNSNNSSSQPTVYIGHDTRKSAQQLVEAAVEGAQSVGANVQNWGLCTTPEFHFRVMTTNRLNALQTSMEYVQFLTEGFVQLVGERRSFLTQQNNTVWVDCANGVGGVRMKDFLQGLKERVGLNVELKNVGEGVLNHLVGSDFVEKEQKLPENFEMLPEGFRGCSMDGDADRLVYFTKSSNGLELFNGDKIAALAANFIQQCIDNLKPSIPQEAGQIRIGVVQTAYANGASTVFLKDKLGVEVVCTKTGVKHLHHEALAFDVGIYYEANGHGTVLFSDKFMELVKQMQSNQSSKDLLSLYQCVNQAVGDAISCILMVEGILIRLGWTLQQWQSMYTDLPSKQLKVRVKDRSVIVTTPSETQCLQPQGLQQEIDKVVQKYDSGRAFARPSGTEDVVRVYAEASSKQLADQLAVEVGVLVYQLAGGLGEMPSL